MRRTSSIIALGVMVLIGVAAPLVYAGFEQTADTWTDVPGYFMSHVDYTRHDNPYRIDGVVIYWRGGIPPWYQNHIGTNYTWGAMAQEWWMDPGEGIWRPGPGHSRYMGTTWGLSPKWESFSQYQNYAQKLVGTLNAQIQWTQQTAPWGTTSQRCSNYHIHELWQRASRVLDQRPC